MTAVWSDQARMEHWRRIEVLAVQAWARLGTVPEADAAEVAAKASFTVDRVLEIEQVTRHDVAAFVQCLGESVGPAGRWIHFGMTSSDVLDTGFALQLREAAELLLGRLERLLAVVKRLALEHQATPTIGRSHGVHAEPTSFGHKVAIWAFELDRGRERLRRAREIVSVGKISGAVGNYAQVDPRVEEQVCAELGLRPAEASNQIVQRDRHAEYMTALAILASTLDKIATEIRHLARTEVREVQEPFAAGQKGSSAMPHKRNPVVSERITGLARVIRGNVQAALEDVVLWHERDISHSSAERVIFPERMRENLEVGGGLAYSQAVLLAIVGAGLAREDAYQIVQAAAAAAWDAGAPFRETISADPRVRAVVPADQLEALFDPTRFLRNLDVVFDRLSKLTVSEGA
jgi:adenylosuccinate lyase